jgi:putative Ca2+/H+ antiporter (TMEM165/GDT1 family)
VDSPDAATKIDEKADLCIKGPNMIVDIMVPLITVGLAELGDKTQLSILIMFSKTREHLKLLLGILLAFLVVDGFAVLFGS